MAVFSTRGLPAGLLMLALGCGAPRPGGLVFRWYGNERYQFDQSTWTPCGEDVALTVSLSRRYGPHAYELVHVQALGRCGVAGFESSGGTMTITRMAPGFTFHDNQQEVRVTSSKVSLTRCEGSLIEGELSLQTEAPVEYSGAVIYTLKSRRSGEPPRLPPACLVPPEAGAAP